MALADVPGMGAYYQRRQMIEQEPVQQLQQVQAAHGLMAAMEKRKQGAALQQALAESGGDVEKAIELALKSGNVEAAQHLAPLAKLAQEKKAAAETRSGLAALLSPQAAPAQNPMVPGPGASVMAGSGEVPPTPAPAANPTQARIAHLDKLALNYANNPTVLRMVEAEKGKIAATAEKAPQRRERVAGAEMIQEEYVNGRWQEIGRGPRFARQIADPNAAGPVPITDDTLAMDAWRYLTDGTLPPNMGRGVQGTAQATKIRNESARLAKEMGMQPDEIRMAQLNSKTQVQAIGQLAKARAQILQFEKTANMNADLALEASERVDRTGVPVLNRWIQAGRTAIAGDVEALKFNAATETFVSEYARVMSGGYGAAQTTEGAQQRAHGLLNTAHNKDQFRGVIGQLKREMGNRVKALNDQMAEERQILRSGVVRKPAAPTAPPTVAPSATPNVDSLLEKYK